MKRIILTIILIAVIMISGVVAAEEEEVDKIDVVISILEQIRDTSNIETMIEIISEEYEEDGIIYQIHEVIESMIPEEEEVQEVEDEEEEDRQLEELEKINSLLVYQGRYIIGSGVAVVTAIAALLLFLLIRKGA